MRATLALLTVRGGMRSGEGTLLMFYVLVFSLSKGFLSFSPYRLGVPILIAVFYG